MKRRDLITVTIITLLVIRLALISVSGTYAKYTTGATGSSTTYVAKWNVKVNEIDLSSQKTTVADLITLVPDSSENVAAGKFAPGHGGHFDVVIDPTGTEVSFKYNLTIDVSKLPTDIELIGYSLGTNGTKDDATEITDNTISREVRLPTDSSFTEEQIETIRVYWMWNDDRNNDVIHTNHATDGQAYSVGVQLNVTQIVE